MSEWTPPTAQQFPRRPTDGVSRLVDAVSDISRRTREATGNLLRSAGITLTETLMTISRGLRVEGDLTSTGNADISGTAHISGATDIDGTLNVDADVTFGGDVDIAGTADVTGQLNITAAGGLWAKYDDGATGARLGPLRTFVGDPDGFGIHIQAPTAGGQYDIFKARTDGAGLKRVQIGETGQPVDSVWGLAQKWYLEATGTGTGTDAGMWLHSAGDIRLTSANFTLTIPWSSTSSAANAYIDANGRIWKSTSARKYKQDIEDAEIDVAAVLRMQPRTWRDRAEVEREPDSDRRYVGFIAEELDDLGLGEFVTRDEDGEADGIAYDRLVAAVIPVLRSLSERLNRLENPTSE